MPRGIVSNRIIKFRAWEIDWKNNGATQGRMIQWDDIRDDFALVQDKNTRYVLMQFTGLHDKNGKEIADGDILVYRKILDETRFLDKKTHRYVTKKKKTPKEELHYYEVFMSEKGQWQAIRNLGQGGNESRALYSMLQNHEVVGDIYSNPDLLK